RCISRHVFEDLGDDVVGGDTFGFGFEVEDQTMAQGSGGDGFDVVKADVEAALGESADFPGENQGLATARTATEAQLLAGGGRGGFCFGEIGRAHVWTP